MNNLPKTIKEMAINLMEQENAPFYIYDSSSIKKTCKSFVDIPYENKIICFASMANANLDFLQIVKESGLSIFVNSIGHLKKAKTVGFQGDKIVFTSSGMDDNLMIEARNAGCMVNLDSLGQLERWRKLFPGEPVGIRCNIGDLITPRKTRGGYFLGKNSRLGLSIDEIKSLEGAQDIRGLHIYVGTDIVDIDYYKESYIQIAEFAKLLPNIEYLDFGGGFGVTTPSGAIFDMQQYSKAVTNIMDEVSKKLGKSIQLILEPGRIIGGEAAWFITKVTDIKRREEHTFIGVNASTAQFTRPLMYSDDAYHPITVFTDSNTTIKASIYGCSTYSRDFFATEIEIIEPKVDDIIAFAHAGSYCASSYTTFLGFEPTKEFFV